MGVFWNSEAEILTVDKDKAEEILMFIKSDEVLKNHTLMDVNLCDCSITFSSGGYGDYGNLFDKICNSFKFPI